MKYVNSQYKIREASLINSSTNQELQGKVVEAINLKAMLANINNPNNISKNFFIYETDWEDLEIYEIPLFEEGTFLKNMYKEWRIELPNLPVEYMPFININFLISPSGMLGTGSISLLNSQRGYLFQIDDINDVNIVQNLVIVAGINFKEIDNYLPIQVKLSLAIHNPHRPI